MTNSDIYNIVAELRAEISELEKLQTQMQESVMKSQIATIRLRSKIFHLACFGLNADSAWKVRSETDEA